MAPLPRPAGQRPEATLIVITSVNLPQPLALLLLAAACWGPLHAAPVPHPDRPDRLVETRDGFSVEYSPGQEAWMEMGFERMQTEARKPAATRPTARPPGAALPGTARFLHENRGVILAAIARQTGLARPTELQGRAFDTFLGYYDLFTELMHALARDLPATLNARHLAIWQRDDLVARLRTGAKIEGMSYDPATDSGRFDFNRSLESPALKERFAAIYASIEQQRLNHSLNFGDGTASASFSLRPPPDKPKTVAPADTPVQATTAPELVIPIIYRGEVTTAPKEADFAGVSQYLGAASAALAEQATTYRNPTITSIILHETAEIGLLENIITSPDRRWLCDGTANYVAWRVARDLIGADYAQQVYNLDAQLRLHAAQQPKINLTAWSAVENEKEDQAETDLTRAHYAFATRVMFLLAERHGETALGQLWSDVARTPLKKVSAKTFATAYRKRFKANLDELIAVAEKTPIPAAIASVPIKP